MVEGVNPGTEVYILDPRQDGLAQMADILAGRSGIDAIHLLSHGSIGELQLGTATLKSSTVNDYAGVLSQISSALSPAGDLLLYGCNVAAGSEGQLLIDTLARLTQADVAASDDLTGAAALGGDWVLEYQTGTIESALPFADGVVVGYGGVLTVPTITDPADLSASEDVAKSLNAVLSVTAPESTTMEAVVSVISGEGVLSNGSVSLSTLAVQGDRSNINTFFNSLSFIPTGDWVGTATIQVTVETDYGTRNDGDITTFDVNITVNPVNDAPVFNASYSPTLTGISEDILDGSNTGTLVSALVVDGSITDVDGTVLESVYVTAVDNAHGTWQYRVGAGSWTPFDFGNNSGKGLLLSATDSVRFVPAANWKGSATITFGAWDGTSGAGTYADISAKGNATPFSTATDTASITVSPVNDTPTTVAASLSVDKNSTLTFSLSSSDNDTGTNSTTDAVVTKYTIVSLSGINGTLTKNGGATVAEGNELTVAEATNMTFTPTNNYIGSATFTFQAIDAAGATSNPSTATIAVQSVNMAPAISVPVGLQTLQTINEESTLTLDNILLSDVDAGLARVKVEVVATYGTVTLSKLGNLYDAATAGNVLTNATGASLTLYGTFSDINAALDNLLYTPSTNYFGAASVVITVDDLGNTGGALKTDSETISLIITNVPDDPQTGAAALAAITEDTLDPNGATIASLLTNFSDVDINTLAGIAISANTADAAHGVWQYSLNNGATWNDVGTVDSATALLLSASTLLRFAPAANYYGTDGLTIHAIDSSTSRNFTTDQNSRRTADVAAEATDLDGTGNTLTTSVTSVNDVFTVVSPSTAKLLVNEGNAVGGSSALLTSQILQITDVEADATHIVYTLQASGTVLGDGVFQKNTGTNEIQTWVNLAADGTFTQADIDASHVRYVHSGAEPLGTEVLSYSVTDSVEGGGGTTEIRTLTLKVSPVNDVPVLYLPGETVPGETPVALTATVPVRGILTFDTSTHTGNHIVVVDSDNTDEQLVFRIESLPTQGYLSYNGKEIGLGSVFNYDNLDLLTYTHTGNIDGIDSFKVTLRDGAGGVVGVDPNKTVTIAVGGQNFAPIWIGNLYGTIWEDPTSYGASANNDGKKLADYAGFDFRDQNSGASVDGYAIVGNTALSGSQGVWQYKTGTNEWSNIGTVTDDGNALVIGADTLVRFSPVSNYNGTPPSLQVRVLDNTYSGSFSASGTTESRVPLDTTNDGGTTPISSTINSLTIAVRAVNDDPYLVHNDGLSLSATSPQMVTITSVMLSVDDIDTLADNNLVYRVTNRIDNGFLLLNDSALGEGGTFTQADITAGNVRYYLPLGSYATNPTFDSFQFQVRDGAYHAVLDCVGGIYSGETLQTLTFNISLNNPITATTYTGQGGTGSSGSSTDARDDYFYTNRNTAITIAESSVVANDSWYSTYTIVAGSSTNGSVSYNADTDQFTFTQTTGFVGTATFNYTLTNQENSSDTATVTVYVLLVNADPTLSVNQSLTSNEGDVATIGNTLLKVDDTDNSADQIRITLTSLPSNGWLYRDTGGNATTLGGSAYLLRAGDTLTQADINAGYLKFDHDGTDDFSSTVAFTYTDGGGGTIGSGTFNLDITPVNDQPELFVDDFKLNEGASYNLQPLIISQDIDGLVDTNYDGIYGNTGDTASDKTTGLAAVNTLTYRISDLPDNGQIRLVDESETYNANDAGTYMVLTTGSIIEKAWVDNNRLYYWHNNSETSSDSFVVELNDNTAQANSTVSATIHVTVLALNDDPVVIKNTSVSGAITYNTSGVTHNPAPDAYSKTSFSLYAGVTKVLDEAFLLGSDPDSSDTQLQFRIVDKPDYGDLLLNSTQVLGVGSRVTQADIVAGNLSYRHDGSETTVDSFVFTLSDGGGGLEPTGTFSITIQPVNDVPTITLPTARTAIEDLPLAISGVSIADVDALSTDALTVTLAATNGVLSLIIDNLTFSTGDGAADATMTFSGTLTNINAALATLSYQGNSNYNGADSITVVVNDGGHNGIDPDTITERTDDNGNTEYQSATATLAINVRSVNDAPEAHVLAATQSVNEDTALVFSSAHSNLLSISDVDAGTNPVSVTVSVTQGTFTLGETSGLSISTGDGSGDATMTFTGTVADINAALAGLSYQGALNYHGAETLTLTVNDQRNTGDLGTAGSDTKTVAITVNPINDNPIATDMSFSGAEDASFIAVALASADVDDGVHGSTSTDAEVNRYCIDTLPSNGTLEYNNGSGWVSVTANQELTKAQGENLRFVPNAHFNSSLLAGNPTFTFIALDAAGAVSATRTATITVTAVNDAPELSGGGDTVTYNEGSGVTGQGMAVVLDANADLAVTDREITETGYITDDFNGATLTVQRSGGAATDDRYGINTSGSVTLSGTNVIYNSSTIGTITNNSATGILVVTFNATAPKAGVDAVMCNVTFSSVDDNLAGSITVAMVFNDGNAGEQGSGGAKSSAAQTFTVTVGNINDQPYFTGNGSITLAEDSDGGTATGNNAGSSVTTIMGSLFADPDSGLAGSTFAGVAIFGDVANRTTQGYWQYSTNGITWYDVSPEVGPALSETNALILSAASTLRFVPVPNFNSVPSGNPGALSVMAIDNSNTGGRTYTAGETRALLSTTTVSGADSDIGTLEASRKTIVATVTQVNDAPSIVNLAGVAGSFLEFSEAVGVNLAGQAVRLDSLDDSDTEGIQNTLATIVDIDITQRVEDTFNGARLVIGEQTTLDTNDLYVLQTGSGVAVTGGYTEPGSGLILFNSGSAVLYNNVFVATITDNSAASGQLVITFNANATSAAVNAVLQNIVYSNDNDKLISENKNIEVKFYDGNTNSAQGTGGELSNTIIIAIHLTSTNDAPLLSAGATISTTEDPVTTTETTIGALLFGNFSDPDTVSGNALGGVALSAYNTQGLGNWWIKIGSGEWTNLSTIAPISATNALLLSADTQVKFVQNLNANTQGATRPSLTVYAVENLAPADATHTGAGAAAEPISFTTVIGSPVFYTKLSTDTLEARVSAASKNVDVAIAAVNDAPTIAGTIGTSGSISVTESNTASSGTDPVQLISSVSVGDPDLITTATLADNTFGGGSITVSLTGGVTGDQLTVSTLGGVMSQSGGADGATLTVNLTASATTAQVNAILEAIRFQHTKDTPPITARAFTITLYDNSNTDAQNDTAGTGGSQPASISGTITITEQNDPPVGTATTVTVNEDTTYTFTAANFGYTQPGDETDTLLAVRIDTLPTNGTLWFDADGDGTNDDTAISTSQVISKTDIDSGKLRFTPVAQANGAAYTTFTFSVQDSRSAFDTSSKTMTVTVTAVNDAPTISDLDPTSSDTPYANPYVQGGSHVIIDHTATFFDQELATERNNWNGATLTISRQTTVSTDDIFSNAYNLGSIGAASGNVVLSSTTVGTYTQTGGVLRITFNNSATTALVNETLQSITYRNAITIPGGLSYNSVTLDVTINDQNNNVTGGGTAGTGQDQGNGG
ncbi:MAG: tandem-95 repeat protein, partial [Chlorobium sp.]|nr:tandem-95 repeat protein [Chlorobium sp.]